MKSPLHHRQVRVLIADDHALIRKGLKQLLDDTDDLRVTGEAETGMEAIKLALSGQFDVILLDISMPDKHGIEVLQQIKHGQPELPVLILSMHPEEQYALRSLKAGAAGYLNKQSAPAQLVTAIRQVARGKKYISTEMAEQLAESLSAGYQELLH
ncbi:MAG: hypothetical protein Fur0040_07710 [Sideroxydans sp.]